MVGYPFRVPNSKANTLFLNSVLNVEFTIIQLLGPLLNSLNCRSVLNMAFGYQVTFFSIEVFFHSR